MFPQRLPLFASLMLLLGLDRWLKILSSRGAEWHWWIFHFIYLKNTGVIFSWPLPGKVTLALMLFGFLLVTRLCYSAWRSGHQQKLWASGLLLVGAISNIYDRVAYGSIIDWAYVGHWWPVFNLADILIILGLVLYLTPLKSDKTKAM